MKSIKEIEEEREAEKKRQQRFVSKKKFDVFKNKKHKLRLKYIVSNFSKIVSRWPFVLYLYCN